MSVSECLSGSQKVGLPFTLTCKRSGCEGGCQYKWYKDGAITDPEAQQRLKFDPLKPNDSGSYACSVLFDGTNWINSTIRNIEVKCRFIYKCTNIGTFVVHVLSIVYMEYAIHFMFHNFIRFIGRLSRMDLDVVHLRKIILFL